MCVCLASHPVIVCYSHAISVDDAVLNVDRDVKAVVSGVFLSICCYRSCRLLEVSRRRRAPEMLNAKCYEMAITVMDTHPLSDMHAYVYSLDRC